MVDLVLPGGADGGLAAALESLLCGSFRVARTLTAPPPDFLLTKNMFQPQAQGHILLCTDSTQLPQACPPGTVGVLQAEHHAAARLLGRLGVPAVSCGMASTDTLTFSSLAGESAVVCLQRGIPSLGGAVVEPGEALLARTHPVSDYALMCAVAALLLTGGWELLARAAF